MQALSPIVAHGTRWLLGFAEKRHRRPWRAPADLRFEQRSEQSGGVVQIGRGFSLEARFDGERWRFAFAHGGRVLHVLHDENEVS